MEQIERVALDLKSARIGTLRVASMHTLGLSLLSESVRQFSLSRPELAISLDVRNSLGVMELAAAHQIDIGFVQMSGDEYPGSMFSRYQASRRSAYSRVAMLCPARSH
jgi:DNA-binding transcriptional LysR family regulator